MNLSSSLSWGRRLAAAAWAFAAVFLLHRRCMGLEHVRPIWPMSEGIEVLFMERNGQIPRVRSPFQRVDLEFAKARISQ